MVLRGEHDRRCDHAGCAQLTPQSLTDHHHHDITVDSFAAPSHRARILVRECPECGTVHVTVRAVPGEHGADADSPGHPLPRQVGKSSRIPSRKKESHA